MKLQIFTILAVAATCLEATSLKMTISHKQVDEGENVVASCEVKNLKISGFVYWVKKVPGSKEIIIATNTMLSKLYQDTGRYELTVHPKDNDVTYKLNISNIKAEDSGEIGCKVPDEDNVIELRTLSVIIPVGSAVWEGYADGQKVGFEENVPRRLVCHIKGGSPEPTVRILSGNKVVTERFEKDVKTKVEGNVIGLQRITYEVTLSADYKAAYSDAGRNLTCEATVGVGNPKVQSSLVVSMQFSPKFDCGYTTLVKEHAKNVTISCRINADPPITDVYWFWHTVYGKANQTLRPGQVSDPYTALSFTNGAETTLKLRIKEAYRQHFRSYVIFASNDLGRSNHTIELQMLRQGESGSGAGRSVAVSSLLTSILLILGAYVPSTL